MQKNKKISEELKTEMHELHRDLRVRKILWVTLR